VLNLMNVARGPAGLLVPAIVTACACGLLEILQQLLARPLSLSAQLKLVDWFEEMTDSGDVACFNLVASALGDLDQSKQLPFRFLVRAARAGQSHVVEHLLALHSVPRNILEMAALRVAKIPGRVDQTLQLFDRLFELVIYPSPQVFCEALLMNAAGGGCIPIVRRMLQFNPSQEALSKAAESALHNEHTEVLQLLLTRFKARSFGDFFKEHQHWIVTRAGIPICRLFLDYERQNLHLDIDFALAIAVSVVRVDVIRLCLQQGACAHAYHDYAIYLAAVSGRVDVMELLLGAADVDAECAAGYRQQMGEPAGLLDLAERMRWCHKDLWDSHLSSIVKYKKGERVVVKHVCAERQDALCAALCGANIEAVRWLLTSFSEHVLFSAVSLNAAMLAGDHELVSTLLDPQWVSGLRERSGGIWSICIGEFLLLARNLRNFRLTKLLFNEQLRCTGSNFHWIQGAVHANDAFSHQYLFNHRVVRQQPILLLPDAQDGLDLLMAACMTGGRRLCLDVWRWVRRAIRKTRKRFWRLIPRVKCALKLCKDGDTTPLMMVLLEGTDTKLADDDHPMFFAAQCGNLAAVQLWLKRGVPARLHDCEALCRAVKYGHKAVAACLIAHGAELAALPRTLQEQAIASAIG